MLLQHERNGIMCMNLNACLYNDIMILYAINHYFYTIAAIISKDRYYTHSWHIPSLNFKHILHTCILISQWDVGSHQLCFSVILL